MFLHTFEDLKKSFLSFAHSLPQFLPQSAQVLSVLRQEVKARHLAQSTSLSPHLDQNLIDLDEILIKHNKTQYK